MTAAHRIALARLTRFFVDAGLVALLVVAAIYILGGSYRLGPDDVQAAQDAEASLQDAIAQAQAERPELWTPERIARGEVAAKVAAQHAGSQR